MQDYFLDIIHVLPADSPATYEYSLLVNKNAKNLRESIFIPVTYVSVLMESINQQELNIIETTEPWFKENMDGRTFILDTNVGQIQQNYVNLFGWLDMFIIRGDGVLFNILRDMVLNMYSLDDFEELTTYVAYHFQKAANYLHEGIIPTVNTYHAVERICKDEGLELHECANVCAMLIHKGITPHPNCSEFFFVDSSKLGEVHDVIAKSRA